MRFDDFRMPDSEHPVVLYDGASGISTHQTLSEMAVLSGAFNPLHKGHIRLRNVAERILKQEVVFELSVANVEKSSLDANTARDRVSQFASAKVALTNAPLFHDKARVFPGCCFVIGFDTAARIVQPRFYNDPAHMMATLKSLSFNGHHFLVAGRIDQHGRFCSTTDLMIPMEFKELFRQIPETEFREDVSSTELRQQQLHSNVTVASLNVEGSPTRGPKYSDE